MNHAIRASLLSGIVLPGLGQMVLKRYKWGIALMAATLVSTGVIMVEAVRRALRALETIPLDGRAVDIARIRDAVARVFAASDSRMMRWAIWVLLLCWIIGVMDGYVAGRKMDRMNP